ncbi:hypothetical protein K438DRAFT_1768371 [Mycena galopus ATCC 62051]|nr:hypothetical protein K438DRAFT_1768371 [Mycena galopus ATCC 62051]
MGSTALGLHVVRGRKSEGVQHISGRRLKSNNPNTDVELNTELELRAGAVVVEEWAPRTAPESGAKTLFNSFHHCGGIGRLNFGQLVPWIGMLIRGERHPYEVVRYSSRGEFDGLAEASSPIEATGKTPKQRKGNNQATNQQRRKNGMEGKLKEPKSRRFDPHTRGSGSSSPAA